MKDYGDLFLKCDLLFLADVFENVRNDSLKNYGLCLSHYLSAPCLSLDAMFKITKIKLDFIQYPNMFIFFEKGTRGGISYISNRYGTANNKYLKYYDPEEEAKHIIYLDWNDLYGYEMSKFLLTSEFKWKHPKEHDIDKYTNSSRGCVLEVDLEYPKELPKLHNDYPLAPDKIEI